MLWADDDSDDSDDTDDSDPAPAVRVGQTSVRLVDVVSGVDGVTRVHVEVNGESYEAAENERFAERFQVLDITGECATFLFGDNRFTLCKGETIRKVLLPAALPGIVGGVLLALSRAVGETMIVALACGMMPLGAPIGSGMGLQNITNAMILREKITDVPLIIDAGVGTASDACIAMELGMDGVLMNTGIAAAGDPVRMAKAMKLAVESGRQAYLAGRMPKKLYATASSPTTGLLHSRS